MDKNTARPPIISIMGHVDHGKTTLLDTIRKTNVAAREHGGITQHIGAYQIEHEGNLITFVDTPGHAAFEKMRSRGAKVADIVILVVAANDSVKPQTVEAIKHIKKTENPIIVAITKTDLPDINIEKVKKDLQVAGVIVEGYGGDVPVVEVSATKGKGIQELLEVISLVWSLNPEKAEPEAPLEAVIVESFLAKNRGAVVTVIVKKGTLKIGQKIVVDDETFPVRSLVDDLGKNVKEAPPAKPVEILGFKKPLEVGSIVRDQNTFAVAKAAPMSYEEIIAKSESTKDSFKAIIKADVLGSLEAVLTNLPEKILVVASSVGEVTQSDIQLAKIASAPILTFNVNVASSIKNQAEREGVLIKSYKVIYELLDDMQDVASSFEAAKFEAKIKGKAKIVASFMIEGQKIAGAMVTFGQIAVGDQILLKSGEKVQEAKISSLKRFKKDVPSVKNGQDCGVGLTPALDFHEGDILESLG